MSINRVVLVCVLSCACMCLAGKVLVVFPVPGRSHAVLGDSVVKTLLDAGHEVTYVSPSKSLIQNARLTRVNISSLAQSASDNERQTFVELVHNPQPPQKVLEVGTTFARRALEHNATQQLLADTTQAFDVVVAEWFFTGLLAPLASIYNCPLIWYSAVDASWINLQLMHGHSNPAYSADPEARSVATETSVGARAARLWSHAYLTGWVYYRTYYVEAPIYFEAYKAPFGLRGRFFPDYEALVYNGSMLLVNSHPLIGQSLPLPQNTKYVGGHHIESSIKPLPKNLQQLLDRSTNGVIFFNLGSNIKSKDLTERMQRKLLDLFGHLDQTVIWIFDESLMGIPRNVHIVKRAPQASILNHNNTVLFITHGGAISSIEAAYLGVPLIGLPLFGDQFLSVELAVVRGRGIRVDYTQELSYRIYDAIHKILGYSSYRRNAQEASATFRHALVPPSQELLHWIELVMHHGADHLRSSAIQLSIFQKLYLDLVTLAIMLLWFCSKVLKVIKVHWNSDDVDDERKIQYLDVIHSTSLVIVPEHPASVRSALVSLPETYSVDRIRINIPSASALNTPIIRIETELGFGNVLKQT